MHSSFQTIIAFLDAALARLIHGLHQMNVWLVFPALLLIILSDIGLRTVANTSLPWSHEVLGLLLLVMLFLELPRNVQRRDLLQMDGFYLLLNQRYRGWLNKFGWCAIFSIAALVLWQAWQATFDMYEFDEQAHTLPIPYWPISALIGFSGGLMALQSLLRLAGAEAKQS